jgi:hypothetical protein
MNESPPPKVTRRRKAATTKQMNIRMDMALWARLEAEAPRVRRSVGNLLMWCVETGLQRLAAERAIEEALQHSARLLAGLTPQQVQRVITRQRELLREVPVITATRWLTRKRGRPAPRRRQ